MNFEDDTQGVQKATRVALILFAASVIAMIVLVLVVSFAGRGGRSQPVAADLEAEVKWGAAQGGSPSPSPDATGSPAGSPAPEKSGASPSPSETGKPGASPSPGASLSPAPGSPRPSPSASPSGKPEKSPAASPSPSPSPGGASPKPSASPSTSPGPGGKPAASPSPSPGREEDEDIYAEKRFYGVPPDGPPSMERAYNDMFAGRTGKGYLVIIASSIDGAKAYLIDHYLNKYRLIEFRKAEKEKNRFVAVIPPGQYSLKLVKAGCYTYYVNKFTLNDEMVIDIDEPFIARPSIEITTNPPDAKVYLNGELAGRTPIDVKKLYAKEYEVKITKAGYEDIVLKMKFGKGQAVAKSYTLKPAAKAKGSKEPDVKEDKRKTTK